MIIYQILKDLTKQGLINNEDAGFKKLSGGTVSDLFLIEPNIVVKRNEPQIVEAETFYLKFYEELTILPNLLYTHLSKDYLVYTYIEGNIGNSKDKYTMLSKLIHNLLNHYKPSPIEGKWGWVDDPTDSWRDFMFTRATEAKTIIKSHLNENDHQSVFSLIDKDGRYSLVQPYLLHGDCGIHNFIFESGELCGVIDPTPVVGPPIYDFIYAFCSSPNELTREVLDSAARQLNFTCEKIYEEVLIGLYLRLATCIKHHPEDFPAYITAWDNWKQVLGE